MVARILPQYGTRMSFLNDLQACNCLLALIFRSLSFYNVISFHVATSFTERMCISQREQWWRKLIEHRPAEERARD
jgi:hypothetical protein